MSKTQQRSHLVEVILDKPLSRNLGAVQFGNNAEGLPIVESIDENSVLYPSIQTGDVILSIKKTPCGSKAQADKLFNKKQNSKILSLQVRVPDGGDPETCQTTIICEPPLGMNFQRTPEGILTVHSLKLSASRGWFRYSELLRMGSLCIAINGQDARTMDPATVNDLASSAGELVLVTKKVDPDPNQTRYGNWFALWNICFCLSYWF